MYSIFDFNLFLIYFYEFLIFKIANTIFLEPIMSVEIMTENIVFWHVISMQPNSIVNINHTLKA